MIKGYEAKDNGKPWVYVPREPEAFGHIVVVSGKHYEDIGDAKWSNDQENLKETVTLVSMLASKMKSNLKWNGKKCQRVYVATLCETENLCLHFHLIPRYERDRKGFAYLFERELEGGRWMYECEELKKDCVVSCKEKSKDCDGVDDKIKASSGRILDGECIINTHKDLICAHEWAIPNHKLVSFMRKYKSQIEKSLKNYNDIAC